MTAKNHPRRSFSLQRTMYEAIKRRAAALGKSSSQYLHDLAAAEMRAAGFEAPEHVPHSVSSSMHARALNERRRREHEEWLVEMEGAPLPKGSPIERARAAGQPVRVFKLVPVEPTQDAASATPAPIRTRRTPRCEWCGEVAGAKRPLGPHRMHEHCADERTRVETRTEARRRLA